MEVTEEAGRAGPEGGRAGREENSFRNSESYRYFWFSLL